MPSPFPGMDPYLEDRDILPGFHHSLAEEIKGRANARLGARYYALNEPFPLLPIPLLPPDADIIFDLNAAPDEIYQRGAYAKRIDYRQPLPSPTPRPQMAEWLAAREPQ